MKNRERAFLIGIQKKADNEKEVLDSLKELGFLAETAGVEVVGSLIQKKDVPDPVFFIGKGKVDELKKIRVEKNVNVFLFDGQLTPSQVRNIEKETEAKILDRTELILDIFAQRARTHEAQLQVELAQLEYLLPRLTRMWTHLSRQAGGIGTRGPGEKQLEVDRRRIKERIALLKKDIEKVRVQRKLQRSRRSAIPLPVVSLVGYTNSGKSTLLNALSGANVFAEDKLFATLDPTTRRLVLPNNEEILVSDTVGFIKNLPVNLVTAFRATLEEIKDADLLLHVIDTSHPNAWEQIQTVYRVLEDLGVITKPILNVLNKIDLLDGKIPKKFRLLKDSVEISALKRINLAKLLKKMADILGEKRQKFQFEIPYKRMDLVSWLHKRGRVLKTNYCKEKIKVSAEIDPINAKRIKKLLKS